MMAAPGMSQAGAGIMGQVGAQRDPMQTLQNYGGLISPFIGMGSQQSSPMHRNQGAGMLGGAAMGAGIGSMMAPAGATGMAALGGWMPMVAGGLLGGFG